jgi:hypothetical protein
MIPESLIAKTSPCVPAAVSPVKLSVLSGRDEKRLETCRDDAVDRVDPIRADRKSS